MAKKKNLTTEQLNKLNLRRKKARGYALYTGAILAKLPAALGAIGWAPYTTEQGKKFEHWVHKNINKIIPTEVDDKIIQFADKVEDKYVRPMVKKAVDYFVKVMEDKSRTDTFRQDIKDANTELNRIKANTTKASQNSGFKGGRKDNNEQNKQKFINRLLNREEDTRPEILKRLQPKWQKKEEEIWGFP